MRKIKIDSTNGRNTLYINGTPDIRAMSKQDYDAFISILELEIRNYYKDKEEVVEDIKPP
ncbi:MAG: hypothetical protein NC311_08580 [Muribaculaceae bacterium]|nr:hypothetical protein [Muribaculaceae bacterium]